MIKKLEKSSIFISSFCQELCLHFLHTQETIIFSLPKNSVRARSNVKIFFYFQFGEQHVEFVQVHRKHIVIWEITTCVFLYLEGRNIVSLPVLIFALYFLLQVVLEPHIVYIVHTEMMRFLALMLILTHMWSDVIKGSSGQLALRLPRPVQNSD